MALRILAVLAALSVAEKAFAHKATAAAVHPALLFAAGSAVSAAMALAAKPARFPPARLAAVAVVADAVADVMYVLSFAWSSLAACEAMSQCRVVIALLLRRRALTAAESAGAALVVFGAGVLAGQHALAGVRPATWVASAASCVAVEVAIAAERRAVVGGADRSAVALLSSAGAPLILAAAAAGAPSLRAAVLHVTPTSAGWACAYAACVAGGIMMKMTAHRAKVPAAAHAATALARFLVGQLVLALVGGNSAVQTPRGMVGVAAMACGLAVLFSRTLLA